MADNSTANPGSGGDTFRTQDRSGVKTPTVIIDIGDDTTESLVAAGNPLPVTVEGTVTIVDGGGTITVDGSVTVSGTVAVTGVATAANQTTGNTALAAIQTAVEIMDDWDESDRAKVNIIVGQAGITGGAGAVGASTPRTTLASDDPAVVALQIIDDWDESDRAKVNVIVGQAGVAAGVGASGATTQRVVTANAHGKTIKQAIVSLSASGNIVAAAGASKSIRVYSFFAQSRNDTMTLQVTDGNGGAAISARYTFNAREGVSRIVPPPAWICKTSDNTILYATITGTGTIDIEVEYWDDDAA